MIRILQLRDRDADFETERSAETLLRSSGEEFQIIPRTLGRGGDFRDVTHAILSLRRRNQAHDLVHAFGARALGAAAVASNAPILFSPSAESTLGALRWLRAIVHYCRVEVVCPTTTLRRSFVQRGIPFERVHLIRPGVDFSRIRRRRDDELRRRLGFATGDWVLLAAGESTRNAAHDVAAWAASILHAADPKFRFLCWGRGEHTARIQRFGGTLILPPPSLAAQRLGPGVGFEELLPAADALLVTARAGVATLPIAIGMAAALPIIATVTPTVAELLEDRHTAVMASPVPRLVARRVLDLLEDNTLQWSISDQARTEAYEYFSQSRFLNQFRSAYRQIVAEPRIEVVQPAPGPGTRFHARA
jgi:glycosyltransferase involved in cell wall biosynthesis